MSKRLRKFILSSAVLAAITAIAVGAAGINAMNPYNPTELPISTLVDKSVVMDTNMLHAAAGQNAQALGVEVKAAEVQGVIVSLGQWLTLTNSGMNFEFFGVTRSTPIFVADYRGTVDNSALESDFRYDRVVVAIRADTGASMGYVAIPAGQEFDAITIDLPDHYVERVPPTQIAPPPLRIPDASDT
jgi:hypothetical protein